MKFKYKIILGIFIIELILVSALIVVSETKLTNVTKLMADEHVHATLSAVSSLIIEYVITLDHANLRELGEELVASKVLEYFTVVDMDGELLVQVGSLSGQFPPTTGLSENGFYNISKVIEESEYKLGILYIGVSFQHISSYITNFKNQLPLIGILGILLSTLFSWVLGTALSRRLLQLRNATLNMSSLDHDFTIKREDAIFDHHVDDEIGSVMKSFKKMSQKISEQYSLLNKNKVFYESIFNNNLALSVIIDEEFSIIRSNTNFSDYFGLANNPKPLKYYLGINDFSEFITLSSSVQGCEHLLVDQFGQRSTYNIRSSYVYDSEKHQKVGILINCTDTSRLHRLVQETKDAKHLAEEAVKQKELFLANMSHEIRTPLNGMIGSLNLLSSELDEVEREKYVSTAISSGQILLTVVNDILDYSKIKAGKLELDFQPMESIQVVNNIIQSHSGHAENKLIALYFEYERNNIPYQIEMDIVRFSQIIHNLLSNAIKFTENGSVTLSIKFTNRLEIKVQDTGIGMSLEVLDKLFNPFTQADASTTRKYGGTGLGTTIVKQLTDLIGGEVDITSVDGEGTIAYVKLDAKVITFDYPENYSTDRTLVCSSNFNENYDLSVLVVDDNHVNQMIAMKLIEKLGCEVVTVDNGHDAVSALKEQPFDLVLMDIQMPILGGIEATNLWFKICSSENVPYNNTVPIVAMTANVGVHIRRECYDAGMIGFINKPFGIEDLKQILKETKSNTNSTH